MVSSDMDLLNLAVVMESVVHVGLIASKTRNAVLQNSRKLSDRISFRPSEALSQLSLELEPALEYELRVSPRARRLSLRVEPGRGLIVTVPKRFPRRDVPAFVEKNRTWVENALADIDEKTPTRYRQWPPRELSLQALQQTVGITYYDAERNPIPTETGTLGDADQLVPLQNIVQRSPDFTVCSEPGDKTAVASELASQLAGLARQCLPAWLAAQAARTGMHYERVSIRGQRTVWGSYSSSGTLSLNYKLLFLRRELVDYVLLHELAHTLFLDHSEQFWRHLVSMQSNALTLDSELKESGRDVPPWLELAK
jgi:predicted metal-dependent hydrolase